MLLWQNKCLFYLPVRLTSAFFHVLFSRSILRKVFNSQLTTHIKLKKKWVDWTTILQFWKYHSCNLLSKYNVKCILLSESLKIYTFLIYVYIKIHKSQPISNIVQNAIYCAFSAKSEDAENTWNVQECKITVCEHMNSLNTFWLLMQKMLFSALSSYDIVSYFIRRKSFLNVCFTLSKLNSGIFVLGGKFIYKCIFLCYIWHLILGHS